MQDFDKAIRVCLPIDMNKARATNKRRQEKFKKLKSKSSDPVAHTDRSSAAPRAETKPQGKTLNRREAALSSILFPQGL